MHEPAPLRHYQIIRTDDPNRMRDTLRHTYNARTFGVAATANGFFGQANSVRLKHIGLDFCAYGANVVIEFPEMSTFRQQICLSGSGKTMLNGKPVFLSPHETCVVAPKTKAEAHRGAGYRQLVLHLDAAALSSKLESLTGVSIRRPLEFDHAASFRTPRLQNLRRLVLFLVNELDFQKPQIADLALAEFEQAIIVAFLCGHQHNFSALLEKPPEEAGAWQVRLVEAYIEANWDRPLTVEAISGAVSVSTRSIFKSFKDRRGCSPMAFVKELRLRHARDMLCRPEANTSVSAVALQCGFQNLGHFARGYQLLFGELPSETLARARVERS